MKRLLFGFLLGFMVVLTGCLDDDGYSLGDQWIGFGVLQDTDNLWIKLDNGDILKTVTTEGAGYYNFQTRDGLQEGDRIFVNFTILDDAESDTTGHSTYFVQLNALEEILLKQIMDVTPENEDSIGSDPIVVQDVWVANHMINFKLKYWGKYQTHYINLVKQPGDFMADDQPLQLELRHNNNDDIKSIPYTAYVSFHLDSVLITGLDSVQFDVSSVDYDGEPFIYEGTYVYGEND
jgi:hypothetical protein